MADSPNLAELVELLRPHQEVRQLEEDRGPRLLAPGVEYHPWAGGHFRFDRDVWEQLEPHLAAAPPPDPFTIGAVGPFLGIPIHVGGCPCPPDEPRPGG